MKILAGFVISLFLCGCQVDPYTHSPTWTGTMQEWKTLLLVLLPKTMKHWLRHIMIGL